MAILRIRENLDELLAKDALDRDPYDLITLDEPLPRMRRMRPLWMAALFAGALASLVAAFFMLWKLSRDADEGTEQPYAYFEVKVIDPDGRPVAGATVKEGEKPLGVTDSFGEWRRFLRVKLGSTVSLSIAKRVRGGNLMAHKAMAVPMIMPAGDELELLGSVQLVLEDKPAGEGGGRKRRDTPKNRALAERAVRDAAGEGVASAQASPSLKVRDAGGESARAANQALEAAAIGELAAENAAELEAQTDAARSAPVMAKAGPVATSHAAMVPLSFDSVWIGVESGSEARLEDVLASLRKRARELGVRIEPDAAWRMSLRHLEAGSGSLAGDTSSNDLVQVIGTFHGSQGAQKLYSFLRNYQTTPLATARDILWATTQHVRKAYRVAKQGDRWVVEAPHMRLFALGSGRWLEDARGRLFRTAQALDAGSGNFALAAAPEAPCPPKLASCELTVPGLGRMAPTPGWQRLRLKVLGADAQNTAIYVAGYEVQRREAGLYEYWGMPSGGANATVVRGGRVIYRGRVNGSLRQMATLSLPSAPLSQR